MELLDTATTALLEKANNVQNKIDRKMQGSSQGGNEEIFYSQRRNCGHQPDIQWQDGQ